MRHESRWRNHLARDRRRRRLARQPGDAQQGVLLNIVVGIVGAFIGALLFGGSINSGVITVYTFLTSLVGAIILLAVVNLVRRGSLR